MAKVTGRPKVIGRTTEGDRVLAREKGVEVDFSILGSTRRSVASTRKAQIDKRVEDALNATEPRRRSNLN